MAKFTRRFIEYADKYHALHRHAKIEVDWDAYTKNANNPDETVRAVHIYTENLVLSSAHENDTSTAHRLLYSDPDVMHLYGGGLKDMDETESWMKTWHERWKQHNPFAGFTALTRETDTFVGNTMACASFGNDVELVYSIAKNFQGKGYGKEVAGTMTFDWIQYLIESHFRMRGCDAVENVIATAHPENIASIRILEGLGLECYDTAEKYAAPRNYYKMALVEALGNSGDTAVDA